MELQPLTSQLCPVAISWLFDLLMTDVPDLVRVAVAAPMSDHSSLSAVISMPRLLYTNMLVGKK